MSAMAMLQTASLIYDYSPWEKWSRCAGDRVAGVAGLAVVVLIAVLLVKRPFAQKFVVKAYFANAMSLRTGAPVRLAGVDIRFSRECARST